MKPQSYELFKNANIDKILAVLEAELKTRNESPFWRDKVIPFSEAILSVLLPLRDSGKLFNPEKRSVDELTPELFFVWTDFVSFKSLYFTILNSKDYEVDLTIIESYLAKNSVDTQNEYLDFPISTYNLHQGVSNVIKSLL